MNKMDRNQKGLKYTQKMRLKPNGVRCWCQKIAICYVIVKEAKRKKEKGKKETEKELCLEAGGERESDTIRWNQITLLGVPKASC